MNRLFLALSLVLIPWTSARSSMVDKPTTIKAVRKYCKACHAVDNLRFIKSENDEELWDTIFTEKSPKSGKIWAERMIAVLSWPNTAPPPFDQPIAQDSDWMPKGYKRLLLSEDNTNGIPTRQIILETLRNGH